MPHASTGYDRTGTGSPSIKVSLIIPTRNEAIQIEQLLSSIAEQTRQPDEIVIIDRGSADATLDLLKRAKADNPGLRIISAGNTSRGQARNIGIANARHDWIALTDAASRPEPDWLERLVEVAAQSGAMLVCGNFEPEIDTLQKECASIVCVPARDTGIEEAVRGPSVASALVHFDAWKSVGGFPDLEAAEDLFFFDELDHKGCRIGWAPRAQVRWQLCSSLRAIYSQHVLLSVQSVLARRQRYWHYPVFCSYIAASLCIYLALVHNPFWLLLPTLGLIVRAGRKIREHRENRSLPWMLKPARFAGVLGIILLVDLAMFAGWIKVWFKPGEKRRVATLLASMRAD